MAVKVMLEEFLKYYSANGLALNVEKCHILVHRVKAKTMDIFCGPPASVYGPPTEEMKEKKVLRLLGLMIDSELKFTTHTQKVVGGCYAKLGAMKKLVGLLPMHEVLRVVDALIISSVEWAAELYLRCPKNQVKVQKMLNCVMRVICEVKIKDRVRVSDLLDKCQWLNAANIAKRAMLCNMRRILNRRVAPFSFNITYTRDNDDNYSFRQTRGVRCAWKKTTRFVRSSFLRESIELYNQMDLFPKWFEDDKQFRSYLNEKLPEIYGNGNLS